MVQWSSNYAFYMFIKQYYCSSIGIHHKSIHENEESAFLWLLWIVWKWHSSCVPSQSRHDHSCFYICALKCQRKFAQQRMSIGDDSQWNLIGFSHELLHTWSVEVMVLLANATRSLQWPKAYSTKTTSQQYSYLVRETCCLFGQFLIRLITT